MKLNLFLSTLLLPALAACSPELPTKKEDAPQKPVTERKNVRTLPVPYGQKLSCAQMLSETKVSSAMRQDVTVEDRNARTDDVTASCTILGESNLASRRKRKRRPAKKVELCQVEVKCSYFYDEDAEREKCLNGGNTLAFAGDAITCIQATSRSAPRISGLDPETLCKVEITASPELSKEARSETLQSCSLGALTALDKGSLEELGATTTVALNER
jgi:hypothetical protein